MAKLATREGDLLRLFFKAIILTYWLLLSLQMSFYTVVWFVMVSNGDLRGFNFLMSFADFGGHLRHYQMECRADIYPKSILSESRYWSHFNQLNWDSFTHQDDNNTLSVCWFLVWHPLLVFTQKTTTLFTANLHFVKWILGLAKNLPFNLLVHLGTNADWKSKFHFQLSRINNIMYRKRQHF